MNTDAVGMLMISTVVGLITTIFWRWVSNISDTSKDNGRKMDELKTEVTAFKLEVSQNYQSKADAHKDMQLITDMLREIKTEVKELGNKLDKKADKT